MERLSICPVLKEDCKIKLLEIKIDKVMSRDQTKSIDEGIGLDKDVVNLLFGEFRERKKRIWRMKVLL